MVLGMQKVGWEKQNKPVWARPQRANGHEFTF